MFYLDVFGNPEPHDIYLARPSYELLVNINDMIDETTASLSVGLNRQYSFTFDVVYNEDNEWYEYIQEGMYLFVDRVGFFRISQPTVSIDGTKEIKSINANSAEVELEDKYCNIPINMGTSTSLEYFVDIEEEDEPLINPYTGIPYDWIVLSNQYSAQLSSLYQALDDGTYGGDTRSASVTVNEDSDGFDVIDKYFNMIPRIRFYTHTVGGVKKTDQVITQKYDVTDGHLSGYILEVGFINRVEQLISFYSAHASELSLVDTILKESDSDWTFGGVKNIENSNFDIYNKKLQFDISENVYSFLTNTLAQAIECIAQFDTVNRVVWYVPVATLDGDINATIGYDTLVNALDIGTNEDNLATRLYVTGGDDLDITRVNFGSNYVEDLSYKMNAATSVDVYTYKFSNNYSSSFPSHTFDISELLSKHSEDSFEYSIAPSVEYSHSISGNDLIIEILRPSRETVERVDPETGAVTYELIQRAWNAPYTVTITVEDRKRIYVSDDLAEKYNQYCEYRETQRESYIQLSKDYEAYESKISEIENRLPADDLKTDWGTFTRTELNAALNNYKVLLDSLKSMYKEDYGDAGLNQDGSINEEFIKDTMYWWDYKAYLDIIAEIELAIEVYPNYGDKGAMNETDYAAYEDILDDWETEWSLFGTVELEAKINTYKQNMDLLAQESVIRSNIYSQIIRKNIFSDNNPFTVTSSSFGDGERKWEFSISDDATFTYVMDGDDVTFTLTSTPEEGHEYVITCIGTYIYHIKQWGALTDAEKAYYGNDESSYKYDEYMVYYNNMRSARAYLKTLYAQIELLKASQENVQTQRATIVNNVSFESYFTLGELEIINRLIRDSEYSNENIITTSLDTTEEKLEHMVELLEDAKDQVSISSRPQLTFSATADNLFGLTEFKDMWSTFRYLGNYILVQYRDNTYVKVRIVGYEYNPCLPSSNTINIEFSNYIRSRSYYHDWASLLGNGTDISGGGGYSGGSGLSGGNGFGTSNDIDITISNTMLAKLLNTELFGSRVTDVILDTIDVNTLTARSAKFSGLANGTTKIDGGCITTGYIKSANYNGVNNSLTNTTGSIIDMATGNFSFAGGNLKYDGTSLTISGSTVPEILDDIDDAATKATNYVSISGTGIKVAKDVSTATNYALIDSDGLKIYLLGTQYASFGTTATIGLQNGSRLYLENSGMTLYSSSNTQIASFSSYNIVMGTTANNITVGSSKISLTNDSVSIGSVGFGYYTQDNNLFGITLSLNRATSTKKPAYAGIVAEDADGDKYFKLIYLQDNASISGYTSGALNVGCNLDMNNYDIKDVNNLAVGGRLSTGWPLYRVLSYSWTNQYISASSGLTLTLNYTIPTGYTVVGIIHVYTNHGHICSLNTFHAYNTYAQVSFRNHNSSTDYSDFNVTIHVLVALQGVYVWENLNSN